MKFGVDVLYKKLSNKWEFYEIRFRGSLQKKLSSKWKFHEIRYKRSLQKIVK
jgi:ribosome-associated toxin RatA of RatAB toxin-antitoxin module